MKKYRKLINGEKVKELDSSINLIIKKKCHEKSLLKNKDLVWKQLKKNKNQKPLKLLDLCCGTGCLGISIIDELDNAFCDFIDVSKHALTACKKNIIKFKLQQKTKIFHSNLFENYPIKNLIGERKQQKKVLQ